MSVDFNAEFAIGGCFRGVAWFRDELAREPPGIRETVVGYRDRWLIKDWIVEEPRRGTDRILGPGGFAFDISARMVSVYHVIRFSHFACFDEERQLLRRACFAIASMIGSPRALYMHELLPSGFHDGLDLDGSEAKLRNSFGSPSTTFAALDAAEHFGTGCWYSDDFADLRSATSDADGA